MSHLILMTPSESVCLTKKLDTRVRVTFTTFRKVLLITHQVFTKKKDFVVSVTHD